MPQFYTPPLLPLLTGLNVPYDRGYDAFSYRNTPTADQIGSAGYFLRPNGDQINLWVTDMAATFSVSGQTGQSRMLREFFPRSFQDVTLTITGNTASTYDYNRLAAFVREHHWEALHAINNGSAHVDQTILFYLDNKTPAAWKSRRHQSNVVSNEPHEVKPGKFSTVKGGHKPWQVTGYIKSMTAGAVAHEVAPEFQIAFIVATSRLTANTGIWSESAATPSSLLNFDQLVAGEARKADNGSWFLSPPDPSSSSSSGSKPTPTKNNSDASVWSTVVATTNQAVNQVTTELGKIF